MIRPEAFEEAFEIQTGYPLSVMRAGGVGGPRKMKSARDKKNARDAVFAAMIHDGYSVREIGRVCGYKNNDGSMVCGATRRAEADPDVEALATRILNTARAIDAKIRSELLKAATR